METSDKYSRFNAWCAENGVIGPKLQYPGRFGDGLIGVKCTADIAHREAFLYIPYKMLMTCDFAVNIPQLKPIYEEDPIFWKTNPEWEQTILTLFLYWEFLKGTDGFWWPYLDLLPQFEQLPWDIATKTLTEAKNEHFTDDCISFQETYIESRLKFQNVIE